MTLASDLVPGGGETPFRVVRILRAQPFAQRTAKVVAAIAREARRTDVIFAVGMLAEAVAGNVLARKPLAAKIVSDEVWDRAARRNWTSLELEAFQHVKGGFRVSAARAVRNSSLRRVDRLIAPSEYTARMIRGWGAATAPATVLYNAAPDLADLEPADPLPQVPRPRIVMAGRLIPLKRIDGIIRILRRLPAATLIVIGSGESEPTLRAVADAEGVQARVYFTGALSQRELLRVFRSSDLLVLNSSTENCPHVLLEAMTTGLPVVSTRVGGVPELVQHGVTGWLVDPNDPSEMAERIAAALDPAWRRQASEAARKAATRFSWNSHADAVDRLLRDVGRL